MHMHELAALRTPPKQQLLAKLALPRRAALPMQGAAIYSYTRLLLSMDPIVVCDWWHAADMSHKQTYHRLNVAAL